MLYYYAPCAASYQNNKSFIVILAGISRLEYHAHTHAQCMYIRISSAIYIRCAYFLWGHLDRIAMSFSSFLLYVPYITLARCRLPTYIPMFISFSGFLACILVALYLYFIFRAGSMVRANILLKQYSNCYAVQLG